jgi:putative hydrolase of HD superfamily
MRSYEKLNPVSGEMGEAQFELHGGVLASGHAEMRSRMTARFMEPDLHAKLLSRAVMGNIVADHELITRNFPEGKGTVEMLCIYEVSGSVIRKATFALGEKKVAAT